MAVLPEFFFILTRRQGNTLAIVGRFQLILEDCWTMMEKKKKKKKKKKKRNIIEVSTFWAVTIIQVRLNSQPNERLN